MDSRHSTGARTLVVIGDVHANLWSAVNGLNRLEQEQGEAIDQVFSVGDFGLFLDPDDWRFLSGPAKHRHPEWTPDIRKAWEAWRWPLAMIGGNHEPWHKLRDFKPGDFGPLLTFTVAGELPHTVQGLRVYGLSGIYHPDHLEYHSADIWIPEGDRAKTWADLLPSGRHSGTTSPKRFTYYKRDELERVLRLPSSPHLLLLHDWPKEPAGARISHPTRPERKVVEVLRPQFVCCGHHHRPEAFQIGSSECRALNIIQDREPVSYGAIRPGWAWIGRWEPARRILTEIGYWPPFSGSQAMPGPA